MGRRLTGSNGLYLPVVLVVVCAFNSCTSRALFQRSWSDRKRVERQAEIQRPMRKWTLARKEPIKCRIKFNRGAKLKYWKRNPVPWGGNRGETYWDCYIYTNFNHMGYAFSTRGYNRKFLKASKKSHEIEFSNNTLRIEDVDETMIFSHERNPKSGGDQLHLAIPGEERCYLYMFNGRRLVKRCRYPSGSYAHFTVCWADSHNC